MKIIIQKFGGTSVSTEERRKMAVKKINNSIKEGYMPVVVVSALGRYKEPYATDTLLSLVDTDFKQNNKQALDMLMCCGEIISSVIMCNELRKEGIDAIPLTGGQAGIITNDSFGDAKVIDVKSDNIKKLLLKGKIPVVCGFQGKTENEEFSTLGRGGSDTTASLLGASMLAEKIEIYTDVDGIMTADPRMVNNASVIDIISYDEIFQLADQGAKVIHPRAVQVAREKNIPILIKNTLTDSKGTLINNLGDRKKLRLVTSITSSDDRIQISVDIKDNLENDKYNDILQVIAQRGISLDLINIFPEKQIFTIPKTAKKDVFKIFEDMNIKFTFKEECSTIALVGAGMRGVPGVMAKIFKALNDKNIEVLQTADSHMTIWCLVKTKELKNALNSLHKAFNLS